MDSIKKMPAEMRPYERFLAVGADKLTDEELLAIVLRSGIAGHSVLSLAKDLLAERNGRWGLSGLAAKSLEDIKEIRGIGEVKAIRIKCILELSRRLAKASACLAGSSFSEPCQIADFYMEDLRHLDREVLVIMMLDTKNRLIRDTYISQGTVNASLVSTREIFVEALAARAVRIIMIHNHPSGLASPSQEDIDVTKKVAAAGDLLGVELLDHIIIGDRTFYSLRQEGLMQA